MREEREITFEEMEKYNVMDDDDLWEWVHNTVCETPLETILEDCKELKKALDSSAFWFDEESIFSALPDRESRILLLLMQFFYLGAWHGGKAYREMFLAEAGEDLGCYLRMPEESPYPAIDEDICSFLYESEDRKYLKKYAKKIYKLLGLEAL